MKYSIMITSLYEGAASRNVEYYTVSGENRNMYCDAILSAEASSKYILANHRIDEIITLGSKLTYDPEDEQIGMVLREGSSFYASDINELSTYSLLRYRLAQYIDEIKIEEQDIRGLLTEEEQRDTVEFLKSFFRRNLQQRHDAKFNRFFDMLVSEEDIRKKLFEELDASLPDSPEIAERYHRWVGNYLYRELRDTSKMELLSGNEDVKIAFIPTDEGGTMSFANNLAANLANLAERTAEEDEFDFYICIQSDDAKDTFTLMNFMDIVKSMPGNTVKIRKVISGTHSADEFYNEISDDTELYATSDLLTGTRAFLQYGRTDLLMQYWHQRKVDNPFIEKMLYAMRNIDVGISLCDISDIERGITSLRKLFSEEKYVPGNSILERYFDIIIGGIRYDYGDLISGNEPGFIDLVKWAFRKGFWQQTLTIVESKAPQDFVRRGIYYYADSEESKEKAVRIFGGILYDLKPFEKYKIEEDIDHYFIKFYGRARGSRTSDLVEAQRRYAHLRTQDLSTDDPNVLKAFSACPDSELIGSLLYAYYYLGYVRNVTNHARSESGEFETLVDEKDAGERMDMIEHAVENFIYLYDKVTEAIGDNKAEVHQASVDELRAYAASLRPRYGRGGNRRDDRNREDKEDKQEETPDKEENGQ